MKSISCVCAFGFIGMVAAVAGGRLWCRVLKREERQEEWQVMAGR